MVQIAAISQSGVLQALRGQEKSLLDNMIASHRSKKLSDRDAAVGIAVISELRSAHGKLQRALQQGYDVTQQLVEGESNGN